MAFVTRGDPARVPHKVNLFSLNPRSPYKYYTERGSELGLSQRAEAASVSTQWVAAMMPKTLNSGGNPSGFVRTRICITKHRGGRVLCRENSLTLNVSGEAL